MRMEVISAVVLECCLEGGDEKCSGGMSLDVGDLSGELGGS